VTQRLIGIDMGGTKLEAAVLELDEGWRFLSRHRIATRQEEGYEAIVERTATLIGDLMEEWPEIPRAGIGMPGSLAVDGSVKNANTTCLNGRFFHRDLRDRVSRPLCFANDADCFALAEATFGAGIGYNLVFGVILGTGVGGGMVWNGKLRQGPHSICGEWGHTLLWPDTGRPCYCGKDGCVELFLSGPGITRSYERETGIQQTVPQICKRESEGDPAARQCVETWMDNFGRALSNVINILDPDVVVLGGGVSNADCLYDRGVAALSRYVFSDGFRTPVLRHGIGDSAGVLGAALLTADNPMSGS
jgi:fructokinase